MCAKQLQQTAHKRGVSIKVALDSLQVDEYPETCLKSSKKVGTFYLWAI